MNAGTLFMSAAYTVKIMLFKDKAFEEVVDIKLSI